MLPTLTLNIEAYDLEKLAIITVCPYCLAALY